MTLLQERNITLPVISGGSDDDLPGDDFGGGADAFADALAGGGAEPAEPAGGLEGPDGALPPAPAGTPPEMVPFEVHQRQIRENQQYRERWQPLERAYGGLDDDIRQGFVELMQLYAEDPVAAQRALAESFGLQLPEPDAPQYATPDDVQSAIADFFGQRDAQQELEQTRSSLRDAAKEMGYELDSRSYKEMLRVARDEFQTDEYGQTRDPLESMRLAHEAIAADQKAARDRWASEYLNGKTDGVTNVSAGDTPGTEEIPTDLAAAGRAFREALG